MYKIIGTFKGKEEIIDTFETIDEADKMLIEYIVAFGAGWTFYIDSEELDG